MNRHPWSEADMATMRETYAITPNAALAITFGRTLEQVQSKAYAMQLHKVRGSRVLPATAALRQKFAALAAENDDRGGFNLGTLIGVVNATANRVADQMVVAGELFRVRIGHKSVRYFSTEASAGRYQQGRPVYAPAAAGAPTLRIAAGGNRARWPADAEPVITAETKVTIAPAPVRQLRTNTHSPL